MIFQLKNFNISIISLFDTVGNVSGSHCATGCVDSRVYCSLLADIYTTSAQSELFGCVVSFLGFYFISGHFIWRIHVCRHSVGLRDPGFDVSPCETGVY